MTVLYYVDLLYDLTDGFLYSTTRSDDRPAMDSVDVIISDKLGLDQ